MNPDRIRIIKLHKRWADGYTLLWQLFAFLLFGGIYIGLEQLGIGAAERAAAFILLAVMVLVELLPVCGDLAVDGPRNCPGSYVARRHRPGAPRSDRKLATSRAAHMIGQFRYLMKERR